MSIKLKELIKFSSDLTILYVEDDDELREQTLTVFKNIFKVVDYSENGEIALKKYNEFFEENSIYYDLIISDIQMPKLDGLSLSKEILKINNTQKIIITSAHYEKEYLSAIEELGIKYFMRKPLLTTNMLDVLYDACTDK